MIQEAELSDEAPGKTQQSDQPAEAPVTMQLDDALDELIEALEANASAAQAADAAAAAAREAEPGDGGAALLAELRRITCGTDMLSAPSKAGESVPSSSIQVYAYCDARDLDIGY